MRRSIIFVTALLLVLSLVAGACSSSPAPQPSTSAAPKPATSAPAPAPTSAAPAPTSAAPKPTTSAPASTPAAQSAADFFKNNAVTIIVPHGAGGGMDFEARIFASFWQQYTGGQMIVKNKGEAGGIPANNDLFKAKPDGTTIAIPVSRSTMLGPYLTGDQTVTFDPAKYSYILQWSRGTTMLALGTGVPYKTLDDLKKAKNVIIGDSSRGSVTSWAGAVAIQLLGLDGKMSFGYNSSAERTLAGRRGEITGTTIGDDALVDMIKDLGYQKPLLSIDYERSPTYKDVPSISEVVKATPEQKPLLDLVSGFKRNEIFYAPPGMAADRLKFLRDTAWTILHDKNYLAQMALKFPIWTEPIKGEDVIKDIQAALSVDRTEIKTIEALIDKMQR